MTKSITKTISQGLLSVFLMQGSVSAMKPGNNGSLEKEQINKKKEQLSQEIRDQNRRSVFAEKRNAFCLQRLQEAQMLQQLPMQQQMHQNFLPPALQQQMPQQQNVGYQNNGLIQQQGSFQNNGNYNTQIALQNNQNSLSNNQNGILLTVYKPQNVQQGEGGKVKPKLVFQASGNIIDFLQGMCFRRAQCSQDTAQHIANCITSFFPNHDQSINVSVPRSISSPQNSMALYHMQTQQHNNLGSVHQLHFADLQTFNHTLKNAYGEEGPDLSEFDIEFIRTNQ